MNLDEIKELVNRAAVYLENDELELAAEELITASNKVFDLAENAQIQKGELVKIGSVYVDLARQIYKDIEMKLEKPLTTTGKVLEEGERDWSYEIPDVRFKDVIGMESLKKEITAKLIKPALEQGKDSLAEKYRLPKGYGLLLYGPTGTGKTYFARAVAGELGWPLYVISGSSIISKYVGESERNLMQLFTQAKSHKRSVIFIDEIETIFPDRKTRDLQHHEIKLAGEFLTQMDGIDPVDNWMLIIGATNNPSALDEALLRDGRLGIHAFVGLPDEALITQMLNQELSDLDVGKVLNYVDMAKKLKGLTLNSVKKIAEEVRSIAYTRDHEYYTQHPLPKGEEQKPLGIRVDDFDQAIISRNPIRISEKALEEMRLFQEQHLNHISA